MTGHRAAARGHLPGRGGRRNETGQIARIAARRGAVAAQTPIELPCVTPAITLDPDCAPAGAPPGPLRR